MILVHGFAGGISAYYILKKKKAFKFSLKQLNILWFLGPLGGIFPDFDLILPFLNRDIEHRRLLTHSIVPYTLLFIIVNFLIAKIRITQHKKDFIKTAALVFYIGVCTHILLDCLVGGLQMFSPFTNLYIGFNLPFVTESPDWQYGYFTSFYAVAEAFIAAWFFYLSKDINNKIGKYLPVFFFFVAILASMVFMYL
jgi:membrane-bound metal-dependent hydrolase YbcI (DUF457 family)